MPWLRAQFESGGVRFTPLGNQGCWTNLSNEYYRRGKQFCSRVLTIGRRCWNTLARVWEAQVEVVVPTFFCGDFGWWGWLVKVRAYLLPFFLASAFLRVLHLLVGRAMTANLVSMYSIAMARGVLHSITYISTLHVLEWWFVTTPQPYYNATNQKAAPAQSYTFMPFHDTLLLTRCPSASTLIRRFRDPGPDDDCTLGVSRTAGYS